MGMKTGMGFGALALTLAACGSSANPEPVEQIIVREIGGEAPPAPASDADPTETGSDLVAAGRSAFAVCSGCHSVDADAPSTAGPNLFDVGGRNAGARDDFAYSEALQSSGIVWTEGDLDAFLAAPMDVVPGTTMVAGAVSAPEQRAAIIAYLGSLGDGS